MLRYRKDSNHNAIRDALRKAGRVTREVAHLGSLGCDLISTHVCGWPVFIEIKNPEKAPSARRLTKNEEELQLAFPDHYYVVLTLEQAFAAVGLSL